MAGSPLKRARRLAAEAEKLVAEQARTQDARSRVRMDVPPPPIDGYPRADLPGQMRRYPSYDDHREEILVRLYEGETVRAVLREMGIASWTHYKVMDGDPAWSVAVARARESGAHALADSLLDPERYRLDPRGSGAWSRSVQWHLERTQRVQYGQRVDVTHTGRIDLVAGLEAALSRESLMIEARMDPVMTVESVESVEPEPDSIDDAGVGEPEPLW